MTLSSGDILVYDGTNWVNSSFTSYTQVTLSQPAPATSRNGLLNLGDGGFSGGGSPHFAGNAAGTVLAINAAAGFAGRLVDLQLTGFSTFAVEPATATANSITRCWANDLVASGTNSNSLGYALQLNRGTLGTPANGFGTGIQIWGHDSAGSGLEIGNFQCIESTATAGSVSSYIAFFIRMAGGYAEIFRFDPSGTAPGRVWCKGDFFHNPGTGGHLGFFGIGPVVRQTGGALTAGATYTANEQSMLNKAYSALQAYGLLT